MWSDYALTVIDSVARLGSFSAAGQELHRVPSAISYTVRQVEEWLAVELFERRHRDVLLTPAGQHFILEARSVLKTMQATRQQCQQLANGWRGQVMIAVDSVVKEQRVRQLITDFYRQFNDIELHISEEVFNGVWDALADGRADLVIGATQARPVSGRFAARDMGRLKWRCIVAQQHPLAQVTQIDEAQLRQWPSLMIEDTARTLPRRHTWNLDNQRRLVVPNWSSGVECIVSGLCVAMVPAHLAAPLIANGQASELHLPAPYPDSLCCVSWQESRLSPALQWILDYLGDSQTLNQEWLAE